jgi:hypothetical protein
MGTLIKNIYLENYGSIKWCNLRIFGISLFMYV